MKYNFDEIINRENTDSVKYDLREVVFGNKDLIPMWVADMDFKTPDFITDALKKRCEHPIFGYTFRSENFNNAVSNWMHKRHNWNIDNSSISFSPGVVPALHLAILAFTKENDKIIVQPPVYFPFFSAIENHNRIKIDNPLKFIDNKYEMDFDYLEQIISDDVKMLFLCNPHNPSGRVWSITDLKKLGNLCVKNNIIIISDEIHSDLILKPNKHIPIASISEEIANITITLVAPSKTFNLAGLHTSAVICSNDKMLKSYNKTLENYHFGDGNIFGAIALESAYNKGEDWLEQMLEYIKANVDYVQDYLIKNISQIKLIYPEATYLLWLDCRGLKLSNKSLKNFFTHNVNIGLNDGRVFGEGGSGFFRMNVACPRSIVKHALVQLKNEIEKLK